MAAARKDSDRNGRKGLRKGQRDRVEASAVEHLGAGEGEDARRSRFVQRHGTRIAGGDSLAVPFLVPVILGLLVPTHLPFLALFIDPVALALVALPGFGGLVLAIRRGGASIRRGQRSRRRGALR